MTHKFGNRCGVRYLNGGIKVYHLPVHQMYNQTSWPMFFCIFPYLRNIFIRERIFVVHGHQARR